VQFLDALFDFLDRHAHFAARSCCALSSCGRNSCSGGSRKRIVAGRPFQRLEDADEVALLVGQELRERFLPVLDVVGEDHLAHGVNAVALEEHVLGAAQADARGAERDAFSVCSGVSALVRTCSRVTFEHQSISWLEHL
jgi:hypothetical protein